MFLDASAMVAIIAMEDDAASLTARLGQVRKVHTSAVAVFETATGLARIAGAPVPDALAVTERFLAEVNAEIVPIGITTVREAVAVFARYGKGRHRAALNMGDCFAYACARELDVPLLCKGNDFPLTDIALA